LPRAYDSQEPGDPMETVTAIGFDIAKSVFAGPRHQRGEKGKRRHVLPFFQKQPPCFVGIEACASSHYWSCELQALGHTVRLMPAAYVKACVKRQKNDAADAICAALTRPNMRFVATKGPAKIDDRMFGPGVLTSTTGGVAFRAGAATVSILGAAELARRCGKAPRPSLDGRDRMVVLVLATKSVAETRTHLDRAGIPHAPCDPGIVVEAEYGAGVALTFVG